LKLLAFLYSIRLCGGAGGGFGIGLTHEGEVCHRRGDVRAGGKERKIEIIPPLCFGRRPGHLLSDQFLVMQTYCTPFFQKRIGHEQSLPMKDTRSL